MNKKLQQLKTAWKHMKSYLQPNQSWILFINKCSRPEQKGKKLSLTAKSETDVENQGIETGLDGTVWKEIDASPKPGRTSIYNIFRNMLNGI